MEVGVFFLLTSTSKMVIEALSEIFRNVLRATPLTALRVLQLSLKKLRTHEKAVAVFGTFSWAPKWDSRKI